MIEKLQCPNCEQVREVELIEREESVSIKGREVSFKAHVYRCLTCGAEFEAPGQLDENLEAARETYAQLYESPSPERLIALRGRYGASQKAFGLILGFGDLTMNSYEQGSLPNPPNRLLLRLAENPAIFRAMYAINSPRIGALQRQRIESSQGFRSVAVWTGLEVLAEKLTPLQRVKIETCADCYGQTVLQQIVGYVTKSDYSRLIQEASWSESIASTPVDSNTIGDSDAQRAAS